MSWVRSRGLDGLDVDSAERLVLHRRILSNKTMLREVFTEFHHIFKSLGNRFFEGDGLEMELGAGVYPIRETYSNVLATDVYQAAHLDLVMDSQSMDLPNQSVKVIYCQNCFHHFSDPECFFSEVDRVVVPGGGVVLLEPYYGLFASFLFRRLFETETFDKTSSEWKAPVVGPMSGANQALSYIIFVRDRKLFEDRYPSLEVVHQSILGNWIRYLCSGGLNFRQFVPNIFIRPIKMLEIVARPFSRFLALHHVIVIRKKTHH